MLVTVTGGAGYIGACVVEELLRRRDTTCACSTGCCTDRRTSPARSRGAAPSVVRGDIRDAERARARSRARTRSCTSPRSSAIRPARKDPEASHEVNVEGSQLLVADAAEAGRRSGWSSPPPARTTAAWPTRPSRSTRPASSPRSRSTPSRRSAIEQALLGGELGGPQPTCLRFATVYGVGPRMRFDLTVNEFTRDLWDDRELEVFGELFWRPYVHVRDAARGICTVLDADAESWSPARSSTSATATRTTASSTSSR